MSLHKIADDLLKQADQFQRLRELGNRKNYPYKVKQLHAKITEEHSFWSKKNPSEKLLDLKKDLTFIESQLNESNPNKERIDILVEKYNIGYGKSNR